MTYRGAWWLGMGALVVLASSTARAEVTVTFEDPMDGDVIAPDHEIVVRIGDTTGMELAHADIFIDGALPDDWPGCDAPGLCGVVPDLSPGMHELTATAHLVGVTDETVTASITVEVAEDAAEAEGCRMAPASPGAWWAVGLGVIAARRRRRR